MITDTVTIAEFVRRNGITMTAERTDHNPNMDSVDMDDWKCVLRRGKEGRKRMTVYFSQGYGHNGKAPDLTSVLDCLASDSSMIENAPTFEDFANEFGYDLDSRKAERTFKACEHQAKRLENFLGEELYQELLWKVGRE